MLTRGSTPLRLALLLALAATAACSGAAPGDLDDIAGDDDAGDDHARPADDAAPDPGACADRCEVEDARRCQDDAVQRCVAQGADCRSWTVVEVCGDAGMICVDAGSGPACHAPGLPLEHNPWDEPPPTTNLDLARYHQQPLSSNDAGPFSSDDTYEGWCNTAGLYTILHSLVPDLPARLQALDPGWASWRGGSLPVEDPYLYDSTTTYRVQEFLQDRYLGYLVGTAGIGYGGIETMVDGVAADLGLGLTLEYVPLADMRDRLRAGWFGLMNNWEWGGHYFAVVWYEVGADPDDPGQRYYYILDPTGIEADNADILDNLDAPRTASFRALIRSRQDCGAVDCTSDRLGAYVLNATGVNAVYKGNQDPVDSVPMIRLD